MRKDLLIIALGVAVSFGTAQADVLAVPETQTTPAVTLPAKGTTMTEVEKTFGSPRARQPTVGGGSPKQPPITRWDYDGFVVIFEHDRVVDAVIPGAPPRLYNKDELEPVAEAPPMPGAVPPAADAAAPLAEPAADAAPGEAPAVPMPESEAPVEPSADAPTAEPALPEPMPAEPMPAETPNEATPDNPYPDRPPGE